MLLYGLNKIQAKRIDPLIYVTLSDYDERIWIEKKTTSNKAESYVLCMSREYEKTSGEKLKDYLKRCQNIRYEELKKANIEIEYKKEMMGKNKELTFSDRLAINRYQKVFGKMPYLINNLESVAYSSNFSEDDLFNQPDFKIEKEETIDNPEELVKKKIEIEIEKNKPIDAFEEIDIAEKNDNEIDKLNEYIINHTENINKVNEIQPKIENPVKKMIKNISENMIENPYSINHFEKEFEKDINKEEEYQRKKEEITFLKKERKKEQEVLKKIKKEKDTIRKKEIKELKNKERQEKLKKREEERRVREIERARQKEEARIEEELLEDNLYPKTKNNKFI